MPLNQGNIDGIGKGKISEIFEDAFIFNLISVKIGCPGESFGIVDFEDVSLIGDLGGSRVKMVSIRNG